MTLHSHYALNTVFRLKTFSMDASDAQIIEQLMRNLHVFVIDKFTTLSLHCVLSWWISAQTVRMYSHIDPQSPHKIAP